MGPSLRKLLVASLTTQNNYAFHIATTPVLKARSNLANRGKGRSTIIPHSNEGDKDAMDALFSSMHLPAKGPFRVKLLFTSVGEHLTGIQKTR